jgi:hypothetical protein
VGSVEAEGRLLGASWRFLRPDTEAVQDADRPGVSVGAVIGRQPGHQLRDLARLLVRSAVSGR